jgi:hypothetical protein
MHVKTLSSALTLPIPISIPMPVFTHTYNFLQRKLDEFERLKQEIEILRMENEEGNR